MIRENKTQTNEVDPTGKIYDPEGYERVKKIGSFSFTYLLFIFGGIHALSSNFMTLWWFFLISGFVFIFLHKVIYHDALEQHKIKVETEKKRQADRVEQAAQSADERSSQISREFEVMSKKIEQVKNVAEHKGDIIIKGNSGPVNVGPGSITIIKDTVQDGELKRALKIIMGHIEETNNNVAAKFFDEFLEELEREKASKTRLESFWKSVENAAPTIKTMTDVVSVISKTFL